MRKFIARAAKQKMARDAAALYGTQICRKVLPLILIPYLARTLGPAGWGLVAFMQSIAEFLVLWVEFGFNLSATRELAQQRECRSTCGNIMAGVLGSQALLALFGTVAVLLVTQAIPVLRQNPKLVLAGIAYGIAQGLTPLWFFQGLERLKLAAALEITGKVLGLIGVLLFVHSPEESWKVLGFQALAPGLAVVAGLAVAYRAIPFVAPAPALIKGALRRGWPMFVFRSSESLYGVGNSFLLGLFAPAVYVGYFAGAEKITRAAFGLLLPIREVLYPRLSHLAGRSPSEAARLARTGVVLMGSGGMLLGIVIFAGAPWLVSMLMGPSFAPAVTVLRILSLLPFLLGFTNSVGLQWLLPLGRDAVVNRTILSAGILNVALALFLAPRFAHIGMAWAIVITEIYVCISFIWIVAKTAPFWGGTNRGAARPGVEEAVGLPVGG